MDGIRPKDITPKIFELSRKKRGTVALALREDNWVNWIDTTAGLSLVHLEQFIAPWNMLLPINLQPGVPDTMLWKLSSDGSYSAKTAYLAQFAGLVQSNLQTIVWKAWAPQKCKLFAWLVTQNRVWTADRLQRRGWPNCDRCPLCNQVRESAAHLLFKCRFSIRVWKEVLAWLHLDVDTTHWLNFDTVRF